MVLDLGGGEGFIGSLVAGPGKTIVIDAAEDAVRAARERGLYALVGDVRRLPVKDEVADVVLSSDVLEHLAPGDVPAAVEEMARVLKPTSVAVVHTSVYGFYLRRWLKPGRGRLDADDLADGHMSRLTARELYSAFARAGFTLEKYVFYKHFFQPLARLIEDAALGLIGKNKAGLTAEKATRGVPPGAFMNLVADMRAVPAFIDLLFFRNMPGGAGIFKMRKR